MPALGIDKTERIYIAYFNMYSLDILPGSRALGRSFAEALPVRNAALALAAASLANQQCSYKSEPVPGSLRRAAWVPKGSHESHARLFAQQALKDLESDRADVDSIARLAAWVLLAFVEAELGTVRRFWYLVGKVHEAYLGDDTQLLNQLQHLGLREAVMVMRALQQSMAGPHTRFSVDLPGRKKSEATSCWLNPSTKESSLLWILTTAIHIGNQIIWCRTMRMGRGNSNQLLKQISEWYSTMQGEEISVSDTDDDGSCSDHNLLQELDRLHSELTKRTPPKGFESIGESLEYSPSHMYSSNDPMPEPLHFDTHEEAMEPIKYLSANIMCCQSLQVGLLDPKRVREAQLKDSRPNASVYTILRIAAGLDPAECARRNIYRKGVAWMLFNVALRFQEPASLSSINSLLQGMEASGSPFEDAFVPIPLFRRFILSIWREFEQGRHIFCACVGAGPAFSKTELFSKSSDELLILHGVESTGRYFNDCVSMVSLHDEC
ncbi:hypothetical protein HJFPF1_13070 [Paramyrothecium foliicola]|nr:hypothetical protein HJFPF1_13070 [Paramyrothecium foliicola]